LKAWRSTTPFPFRLPALRPQKCAKTSVCACLVLAFCPALFAQASGYLITTVAGGGSSLGDNGPATSAQLGSPFGVAVDSADNLYPVGHGWRRQKSVPFRTAGIGQVKK
jgi:hypothetical protein